MAEEIVDVNGVRLAVEAFGDRDDPPVLLVGTSMLTWDEEFCARVAAGGRFVIRYDPRDTGRSVAYEPGAAPYSLGDLVDDAAGVLGAYGLESAHIVGFSVGGWIAQLMALDHPGRVASLTLISTRPTAPGPSDPDLPEHAPELMAHIRGTADPDWPDRAAVIEYLVAMDRIYAGPGPFDEEARRAVAGRVFDRTGNLKSSLTNIAFIDHGPRWRERLGQVSTPTLVVHGTADPFFPYGNGTALAAEIPGARLLTLEGTGHQLPPRDWDVLVPALLHHTSGGWGHTANRLAARSLAAGDPTGWFERLYAAAGDGEVPMPWDRAEPRRLLGDWAGERDGTGRRAVVVGCGLGADAEYLAGLGYETVAFDISPAAIRAARSRHPGSKVRYVTANLLEPPPDWIGAFDLVAEIHTVQALPDPPRTQAIAGVVRLVAPGGTLIVIAAARDEPDEPGAVPPWPLTRTEVESFGTGGLTAVRIERLADPADPAELRWRAEFRRNENPVGDAGARSLS